MVNPNLIKLAQEYGSDVCPDVDEIFRKPKKKLEDEVGELGKDYGLIFVNDRTEQICTILDGKITTLIANQGDYHKVFFDGQDLYYTKGNCLYKWPSKLVRGFGIEAWGITKYKGEIIVALAERGEIVKSTGEVLATNFVGPIDVNVFKGELYHTEGRDGNGLVKTLEKKSIAKTGDWANGLTVLGDKLYFGGEDQKIYSYDGSRVEEVCDTDFCIWTLHGVQDGKGLIYAAGGYKKGILVVPLDNPENQKIILEDKIYNLASIVSTPIDFVKELIKNEIH